MIDIPDGLRPYLGRDERIAESLWVDMRLQIPGLSSRTTIQYTPYREVNLPVQDTFPALRYETKTVPINGIEQFATIWLHVGNLFTDRQLENPEHRWRYTLMVWRSPVTLIAPYFWRWLGRRAQRPDWARRGMKTVHKLEPPLMATITTERYQLQRFCWEYIVSNNRRKEIVSGEITCAYIPKRDLLLIHRI